MSAAAGHATRLGPFTARVLGVEPLGRLDADLDRDLRDARVDEQRVELGEPHFRCFIRDTEARTNFFWDVPKKKKRKK